jgi:hypothetical protein
LLAGSAKNTLATLQLKAGSPGSPGAAAVTPPRRTPPQRAAGWLRQTAPRRDLSA